MAKRRKFYKYTLVPLFSLVLSFVLLGKSVEAATSPSFNCGNGTAVIEATRFESGSDDIVMLDEGTAPATNNSWYTFTGQSNVHLTFDQGCGASSDYLAGYINGMVAFNISYPITISPTAYSNMSVSLVYHGIQEETVMCTLGNWTRNGSTVNTNLQLILNNYSLPLINTGLRGIELGYIEICMQFTRTADGTVVKIYCTPTLSIISSNLSVTATAIAGQSIAGQVYAAIENSTSVSEIVTYLSLIEDASGDINVAVSHINQTLLPNVITYLQSLIANTNLTNTKLNTLITYLNAISSTWPDYSAQVLFYLSQLVTMNEEQSSLAAEVESQYQAKASEGAELNQGMQVVIPTVNQDSFNINANVDSGTVTTLSAFWALFPANALIGTLFAIAIAGIAAGFFLYGKKR